MLNQLTTLTGNRLGRAALLGLALLLIAAAALVLVLPGRIAATASPGLVIEGHIVSGSNIYAYEGQWSFYTVRLATKPTADVTVTLKPHNDSSKSVHVRWLSGGKDKKGKKSEKITTFTPSNWNTPQTVYIWGHGDERGVADEVDWVYHIADSDDPDYDFQEVYKGWVTDDDGLSFSPSASSLTVTEKGSATYKVSLVTQPTGNVNVSFAVAGDESITVSPSSLTFTGSNYLSEQTVTVSAAADADTANGTAVITHTANGANYTYHRVRLSVTESDTGVNTPPATPTATPTPGPSVSLVVTTPAECDKDTLDTNDNPVDGMKVAQGESCTFNVKLGKQPNADVPVHVYEYGDADGVLSQSPAKLVFTTSNWNTKQTVTVTSSATQYHGLRQANLLIRTGHTDDTTGYHNLPWTYLRVNQVKGAGILTTGRGLTHSGGNSAVSVTEGASVTYDLKLNTKPTHDVTITIAQPTSGDADLTLVGVESDNQVVRTFTPSNWNTAQQVTIAAAQDVDLVNGTRAFVHTAASDDADYNGKKTNVTATEVEDDKAALVLSSTAVTVPEGGSATYTVKLSNQPNAGVAVRVGTVTTGDSDITVNGEPVTLNFSTSNWNVAQTITVSAAEDGDDIAGTRNIANSATGAEFAGVAVDVTATESDNDRRGFVVSPTGPVHMNEGGTHTYTIKLGTEPTADVAVALSVEGDSDITVSPASLTFTSGNYGTAQTVTITAADDNTDYADDTATIGHGITTTDAIYTEQFIPTMYVTAADNDAALMLSVKALQVAEGGTANYTVKLTNQPTGDVTVTIAEATSTSDDSDITVSNPSNKRLTFTTSNWNTPQTVTLRAANDTDAINGTRAITHTASGGGFSGTPAETLTATESDRGSELNLQNALDTGNVSSLSVAEGSSSSYRLKLDAQPAANVTVALTVTGDSDITVNPASLTFTSQNYSTLQTVTVSAATDGDLANGTATISHAASGGGYNGKSASLTATEIDGTGQIVLRNAADNADITAIDVPEQGSATYKVKLSHLPAGNVTVTLALQSTADGGDPNITASATTLSFNTQNWNTAQEVTLSAADDADTMAGTRNIVHTASGGGYNTATTAKTLTATEMENDYGVSLSEFTKTVTEGSTATYTVKLSVLPTGNVTVAIAKATGGDASITASPATLNFTANDYNTAQTVTLTAAEDNTDIVNGTATFTHTASGANYGNTPVASLTATESDNDTGTVLLRNDTDSADITTIDVPENTSNTTYKVKLSHQPSGNVTVRLTYASGGDTNITASPTTLSFNATNWSTAKTVTLRAADDADLINGSRTITHTASGGGYTATADLVATEAENDKAIILTPATLSVGEGSTATYTVKLSAEPTDSVTVTITEGTTAPNNDTSITVTSTKTLTFTAGVSGNWDAAQTVTVSAAADDADLTNGSRAINHTATSVDTGYNNITASLTATEADDDEITTGAIKLRNADDDDDITTQGVGEGATATYKVKLAQEPRADVTVTIAEGSGDTDITVSSPSNKTLTFTPSNWNTAQSVTLSAMQDSGMGFGSRTITHTASGDGSGYASATAVNLTAQEWDDDVLIQLMDTSNNDTNAMTIKEGTAKNYTVKLSAQPLGDVTITLSGTGDNDIKFDADLDLEGDDSEMILNATNWSDGKEVAVRAAPDSDSSNGAKTITHRASGGGYDYAAVATLTATEDDGPSLYVNPATITATTATLTVYGHTGNWYYKATASPHNTCSTVQTGTATVTGLTKGTTYTYTAYTDSGCTTANTLTPQAVFRTANPTLTQSAVTATTATLTLGNWNTDSAKDGSWYYMSNAAPHAICSSAQSSLTVDLTGLSKSTSYTYKAYSDSSCTTEVAATNAFSTLTPALTSSPSNTYIQLTLNGWNISKDGNWYLKQDQTCGNTAITTTEHIAISLTPGTSYTFRAYSDSACTAGNEITAAHTVSTTGNQNPQGQQESNPPASVGSVSASRSDGGIVASWPVAATATKYHVNYTTDTGHSKSWTVAAMEHPTNSITIADADDAKSYIVAVRAGNAAGWGGWVNSDAVPPAVTTPGSVSGLSANRSDGGIVASWDAPAGATKYHVNYTTDTGHNKSWSVAAMDHPTNSITISEADDAEGYIVAVRAGNGAGWSGWVNSAAVPPAVTPPGNVSGLSASRSNGGIVASWDAAAGATKYHVTYTTNSGGSWSLAAAEHATTSITIANADNAKSYVVAVRAGNSAGWSGWVNSAAVPPAVTPPGNVTGLSASRSDGSIVASWDAAAGATGYHVVYSDDGKASWTRVATDHGGTSYTISGADASLAYVVGVQAVNSAGGSGWVNSNTVPAVTPPPGSVGSVTATHNGATVSVAWDAADGATGYDVVYSDDGKASWTRAATNQSGASYTLDNADSGKTYVFGVRAVNDAGASGWTNSAPASHSGGG